MKQVGTRQAPVTPRRHQLEFTTATLLAEAQTAVARMTRVLAMFWTRQDQSYIGRDGEGPEYLMMIANDAELKSRCPQPPPTMKWEAGHLAVTSKRSD